MDYVLISFAAFIGCISGLIIGNHFGIESYRKSAEQAGVGEYFIDQKNNRRFRWKIQPPNA